MLDGMKRNSRLWAEFWVNDGAPDAPYSEEHHIITAKLQPFRKAYRAATEDARAALRQAMIDRPLSEF